MKFRLEAFKQILFLCFISCVAIQAWRGLFLNSWNITKSFIQLGDIQKSYSSILTENKGMLKQVKEIQKSHGKAQLAVASKELNLVKDPQKEVVIKFAN
ncbi:MAG: hypothetical protein SFU25_03990 [Candidatus Caenarcaniphilales bacterium]|nr:hypothetical protein [Candidatus Caenarcaniphilales bacterium]